MVGSFVRGRACVLLVLPLMALLLSCAGGGGSDGGGAGGGSAGGGGGGGGLSVTLVNNAIRWSYYPETGAHRASRAIPTRLWRAAPSSK